MATLEAPPQITLAKVGQQRRKEKEKKRGAFMAWWMTPGGMALKGGLAKIAVAMLIGCIGVAAHLAGKAHRPAPGDYLAARKNKPFASRDGKDGQRLDYGGVSGLPSDQAPRGDSLSMIANGVGLDGKTDAQRAAEAAAAAAAAANGAGNGADGKGGAGGDGKDGKDKSVPGAPNVDAAALMAQAAASDKGGGKDGRFGGSGSMDKKFGALSTSFGGSGTSASMLAGGGGMFGGSGGAFKPLSGGKGGTARAGAAGGGVPRAAGLGAKGGGRSAFGQLATQHNNDRKALGTTASETQAVQTGSVYDGTAGQGSSILGNGAGVGGSGVGDKQPSGSGATSSGGGGGGTSPGGGDTSSSPGEGGGPTTTNNNNNPGNSDCSIMSQDVGMTLTANTSGGCVPDANHKDVTPWSGDSSSAQLWSMIGAVALAIGGLAEALGKKGGAWTSMIARIVCIVAAGVAIGAGLAAFMYGLKIFSAGGQIEGVMYMLGGIITVVMGVKLLSEAMDNDKAKADAAANKKEADQETKDALDHHKDLANATGQNPGGAPTTANSQGTVSEVSGDDQGNGINAVNDDATKFGADSGSKPLQIKPDSVPTDLNNTLSNQSGTTYTQTVNADGGATTNYTMGGDANTSVNAHTIVNTDPDGNVVSYSTTTTDANGLTTAKTYNVTQGDFNTAATSTPTGTVTAQTTNGVTTYNSIDAKGVQTQSVYTPASGTTPATYNDYTVGQDGTRTMTNTQTFNASNQVVSNTNYSNGQMLQSNVQYGPNGQVTSQTTSSIQMGDTSTMGKIGAANGNAPVNVNYDANGNPVYSVQNGSITNYYDSSGKLMTTPPTGLQGPGAQNLTFKTTTGTTTTTTNYANPYFNGGKH